MAGFAVSGSVADRIGRKWTISSGLSVTVIALILMCFVRPTGVIVGEHGEYSFPALLFAVWTVKGFGMALVHNCSFPMVVELCSSKKIGQFTGYYYAASMSAQTATPVLLGLLFRATGAWGILPVYSGVLLLFSCVIFTLLVKNVKSKKVETAHWLDVLDGD